MNSIDIIVSILGDSGKKEWLRSDILDILSDSLRIDKKEAGTRFNNVISRSDFFDKTSEVPVKYAYSKSGKFKYDSIKRKETTDERFNLEVDEFLKKYFWEKFSDVLKAGNELFEIEGNILQQGLPEFYEQFLKYPVEMLDRFNAALKITAEKFNIFNDMVPPRASIIKTGDVLQVEEIKTKHVGKFVEVEGRVVIQGLTKSELKIAAFECLRCGHVQYIEQDVPGKYIEPFECENDVCGRKGPFKLKIPPESEYIDAQEIMLESLKGQVTIKVHLTGTLCRPPWERDAKVVRICGTIITQGTISRAGTKSNYFNWMIEANSIIFADDSNIEPPTEKEVELFEQWAKNPYELRKKLIESIAPNIYGMMDIKDAGSLSLFSDWNWYMDPRDAIERSSIHMLLYGDPGIAKTQILKDIVYLAPKGKFGQVTNMTKGGLSTAAVQENGEWCVKSGFFSLGDQGVVGLDEIDKVNDDRDLNCLNSVLNDQIQMVSKIGKNDIPFNTRTAVLSAANPKGGYLKKEDIIEQIAQTIPAHIYQRFDLIFVIRDVPDKEKDTIVVRSINEMHRDPKTNRKNLKRTIPTELFRKYILYARTKPVPDFEPSAQKLIEEYYLKLRTASGEYPIISPRQPNDINRLARAVARREMGVKITEEHVKYAIALKKSSLMTLTDEHDYGVYNFGRTRSQVELIRTIRETVLNICRKEKSAKIEDIAFNSGIDVLQVEHTLMVMERSKEIYKFKEGFRVP